MRQYQSVSTDLEVFGVKGGITIFKIINFVFRVGKGMNRLTALLLVFIKLPVLEENV